jgi:hypothetical protein
MSGRPAIANAGIKFIFSASGKDADELALIDPSFEREIKSVITNLSVGYCVVKLSSRKGDESLPPMILRVDEFKAQPVRTLEQARTDEFKARRCGVQFRAGKPHIQVHRSPLLSTAEDCAGSS